MSTRPQKIQIFNIHPYKTKAGTRYRVKWRVDGLDKSHTESSKTAADAYRSRLVSAKSSGELFDPALGIPTSWAGSTTVAESVREFVLARWPRLKHGTRRNYHLVFVPVVMTLVKKSNRPIDEMLLREYVRWDLLTPSGTQSTLSKEERAKAQSYLRKYSLAVRDLDYRAMTKVMDELSRSQGRGRQRDGLGERISGDTLFHKHAKVQLWLRVARERGHLAHDPFKGSDLEFSSQRLKPKRERIMNPRQCVQLADEIAEGGRPGFRRRYRIAVLLTCFLGLRFGEIIELRVGDFTLPDDPDEWGEVKVSRQLTRASDVRYTDTGNVEVEAPLKNKKPGEFRCIPVPPWLVDEIKAHIAEYSNAKDASERVVTTRRGNAPNNSNFNHMWFEAVEALWPWDDTKDARYQNPLARTTAHYGRHAAVSMWLRAGIEPTQAAEWSGHSRMEVFWDTYSHILDGDDEVARHKLEAMAKEFLPGTRSRREGDDGDEPRPLRLVS